MTVQGTHRRALDHSDETYPELDCSDYSAIVNDFNEAENFRAKTIDYVRKSLNLDNTSLTSAQANSPIIANFKPIGEALSKSYTPDTPKVSSVRIRKLTRLP